MNINKKVSKHFNLGEICGNNEANIPKYDHLISCINLVYNVLEPIRERFGVTKVTSFYRNEDYNKKIGGANNSQHTKGEAVDIILKCDLKEVFYWIKNNLEYDQLIFEQGKNSNWLHISFKIEGNRKQSLIAKYNYDKLKMEYEEVK